MMTSRHAERKFCLVLIVIIAESSSAITEASVPLTMNDKIKKNNVRSRHAKRNPRIYSL